MPSAGRGAGRARARALIPLAVSALIALSVARVIATYPVFSQTTDEAVHILSGYDWWHGNWRKIDAQHPPLSRIFFALPFVLQEPANPPGDDGVGRENRLLWSNDAYVRDLGLARAGNLLFLILLLAIVFGWTREIAGEREALLATALASALPPLIAHAGLATTDLAAATTTLAAAWALDRWCRAPGFERAVVLGVAIGAGVSAKFSFLLFFPAAAAVILAVRKLPPWRRVGEAIVIASLPAIALLLAVYHFSIGELTRGWTMFWLHAADGHPQGAFLFGDIAVDGWWFYFPVAVFFKTPLPLLILFAAGAVAAFRRPGQEHTLIVLAMLAAATPVAVNIGVRHVLPIYPSLVMVAAIGATAFWKSRSRIGMAAVATLLVWYTVTTTRAHPDYLTYFNEAAGSEPWRILADSNFDWGQDALRLSRRCRETGIDTISVKVSAGEEVIARGCGRTDSIGTDARPRGWVAIGEHVYQMNQRSPLITHLAAHPYQRIGGTIRLYRIP